MRTLGRKWASAQEWQSRWPFISPSLSALRSRLSTAGRNHTEAFLERVHASLASEDKKGYANGVISHLGYLMNLLAVGQAMECDVHGVARTAEDFHRADTTGAYHSLKRQFLMKWNIWIISLTQDVKRNVEDAEKTSGLDSEDAQFWRSVCATIHRLFYGRIMAYEIEICGRFCGYSLGASERWLLANGILMGPLLATRDLDSDLLVEDLRRAVGVKDKPGTIAILLSAFGPALDSIARLDPELAAAGAFGTERLVVTIRSLKMVPVDEAAVKRWGDVKSDLRRLVAAMSGMLPPEEVSKLALGAIEKEHAVIR